jgi:hypothetical protein
MKLEYTDERTFKSEDVEFDDEHYEITETLWNSIDHGSPIIVGRDKKSLIFCVNRGKTRIDRELGKHLYKIRIEKV